MFSLEKRRLRGDLSAAFQDLRGAYKQEEDQFFTQFDSVRIMGNGFKLKEGKFSLDVKNFLLSEALALLPRELWVPQSWRC